uniref:non-specific serine/threonine protein kinase n=1 Tax=Chlamydomonas chlamydogama TaxID=225041 RepID=A0A7S2QUA3_9CHLO|mmetsp:Transcript_456/g.940  ORF Transcript_456/g.940 Transcript_456/m.940 type:complete len:625 (+) Transcript_456:143-2017(+)
MGQCSSSDGHQNGGNPAPLPPRSTSYATAATEGATDFSSKALAASQTNQSTSKGSPRPLTPETNTSQPAPTTNTLGVHSQPLSPSQIPLIPAKSEASQSASQVTASTKSSSAKVADPVERARMSESSAVPPSVPNPKPPSSPAPASQSPRTSSAGPKPARSEDPGYVKGTSTWIIGETKDIRHDFDFDKILGKGQFGTTRLAKDRATGKEYACKSISKRKLNSKEEIEDVQREVQVLYHLAGHPNVVRVKGVYEDKQYVHIVMEVATGGELFDRIVKRGRYSEKDASTLFRTMVAVVVHCHNMGVLHRDLKPENFLLADDSDEAELKATDFGLSIFFKEGQVFRDIVGSAFYVAPEVLNRRYSKEADIWSLGVILYILLSGVPPFYGETEEQIFQQVLKGKLDLSTGPWASISDPAKDCVRRMLVRDPKRRATAQQILQHDWMRENGVATDNELEMEVLTRMKRFSAMNRLKKEALKIIATSLPMDEISGMKEIFKDMDKDKSGSITVEEFAQALRRKGNSLPEQEVQRLIAEADMDGSGTIDYEEFLAATINHSKLQREEHLKAAFEHFDIDKDGHITHAELMESLKKLGITDEGIQDIIKEVDKDNSGTIEYNEFCAMMRNL